MLSGLLPNLGTTLEGEHTKLPDPSLPVVVINSPPQCLVSLLEVIQQSLPPCDTPRSSVAHHAGF